MPVLSLPRCFDNRQFQIIGIYGQCTVGNKIWIEFRKNSRNKSAGAVFVPNVYPFIFSKKLLLIITDTGYVCIILDCAIEMVRVPVSSE